MPLCALLLQQSWAPAAALWGQAQADCEAQGEHGACVMTDRRGSNKHSGDAFALLYPNLFTQSSWGAQ